MLTLCSSLEAMADTLSPRFCFDTVIELLERLNAALSEHIELQEAFLFPKLRLETAESEIEPVLAQLEYEHAYGNGLLIEVTESVVTRPRTTPSCADLERIGCLLRHVFEGNRRHLAWEAAALNPLVTKMRNRTR